MMTMHGEAEEPATGVRRKQTRWEAARSNGVTGVQAGEAMDILPSRQLSLRLMQTIGVSLSLSQCTTIRRLTTHLHQLLSRTILHQFQCLSLTTLRQCQLQLQLQSLSLTILQLPSLLKFVVLLVQTSVQWTSRLRRR